MAFDYAWSTATIWQPGAALTTRPIARILRTERGLRDNFDHLGPGGRASVRYGARPAITVMAVLAVAILLSWLVLGLMSVRAAQSLPGALQGPGGGIIGRFTLPELPGLLEQFFSSCLTPMEGENGMASLLPAYVAMWFLMAVAMMLPSAAPMIRTYCEIADTAAAKGEMAVSPLVLVAGYLATWFTASVVFAAATVMLYTLSSGSPLAGPVTPIAAALSLAVAGLYQFSHFKEACLEKCRNPFAILFANWSTRPSSIFRLGAAQGLWCLGCCWALMLVMFAVGIMNIFWMALLGVFAIVEKQVEHRLASRIAGGLLLVWAAALLVISM